MFVNISVVIAFCNSVKLLHVIRYRWSKTNLQDLVKIVYIQIFYVFKGVIEEIACGVVALFTSSK